MKRALIFWFTGLSGSGKTTVANAIKTLLESRDYRVLVLDGDDVREQLHIHLGFTEQDIKKNNSLIADLCQSYRSKYDVILVPIISPYEFSRKQASALLGDGFFDIYFSADLNTVIKRDVKGLYARAKQNRINNLIGYSPSNVYETPHNPDWVINSGIDNVVKSVDDFYRFIIRQLGNIVST